MAQGNMKKAASRCYWLAALMCLAMAGPALADEVKIGQFWIPNVMIEGIANGKVTYTNNNGTLISAELANLNGLKISSIPEIEQAQEAIDQGNAKAALRAVKKAQGSVGRQKWLLQWLLYQEFKLHDQLGEPVDAMQVYIRLAREGAESVYTAELPLKALGQSTDEQKQELIRRIEASGKVRGKSGELLSQLLAQLKAASATDAPATDTGDSTQPANTTTPAVPTQPDTSLLSGERKSIFERSAVPLTREINKDDPVTLLLVDGKFAEARDYAAKILQGETSDMSMRLYQLGIAQKALADAADDPDLYKDAGLSFMRVVTYYSRSSYAGPALLELGYVHAKIGKPEIASAMYDRARVLIGEEEDPELYVRLQNCLEQLHTP